MLRKLVRRSSAIGSDIWPPVVLCVLAGCGRIGVEILPEVDAAGNWRDGDATLEDGGLEAGLPGASNCSLQCENAHGSATCIDGACVIDCANGYADCDGNTANGCEADTAGTSASCGSCARSCSNAHGSTACTSGLCTPSCQPGFGDCDGDTGNGCEADLVSTRTCGTCGVACGNDFGSTACSAARCTPVCSAGHADCDGDPANGCETNTDSDPTHCGSCTGACASSGQICVSGACQASPCAAGRGECDGNLSVTCETDTATSLTNCGFCGNRCMTSNGTPRCTAGSCQVNGCNAGYGNCDGSPSNGCEAALATSTSHCGACGAACTNAHGTTSCSASSCIPVCSTGYGDCDSSRANGCEAALDTTSDCGVCGRSCPANGGTPVCQSGACNTLCDLNGTFALKLTVPASWSGNMYIAAGSGTFQFWMKLQGTHSGNTLSGTLIECGRFIPPFVGSIIAESSSAVHPNTLFDNVPPHVPSTAVTITLSGASPSATLTLPRSAIQAGVRMADPANGTWPASASGLSQVDDDMDGESGITVQYQNTGGYTYPRTSASFTPNRADLAYVASRVAFSLGGTLNSCTQASGAATTYRVDTRIFGCNRASSTQDCTATEATFLDQAIPGYSFSAASYTLLKVGDGASCATVRAAL